MLLSVVKSGFDKTGAKYVLNKAYPRGFSANTPAGVLAENPLGYALFNTYFAPVLSKPDFTTLRSMFQDNDGGLSGYQPDAVEAQAMLIDLILNSNTIDQNLDIKDTLILESLNAPDIFDPLVQLEII